MTISGGAAPLRTVHLDGRPIVARATSAGRELGLVRIHTDGRTVRGMEPSPSHRRSDGLRLDPDVLLAPGLVDLQVNGGFGVDLLRSPAKLHLLAQALPATGVTAFLPALPSPTQHQAARLARRVRRFFEPERRPGTESAHPRDGRTSPAEALHARPLGVHLEGPALNPRRRGAHPLRRLGDIVMARAVLESTAAVLRPASGDAPKILVTLAPELEGGIDFVFAVSELPGVVVAVGHTEASYSLGRRAIEAGAHVFTHFFNAAAGLTHRDPSIAAAYLLDERTSLCLICDGAHVEEPAVRLLAKLVGPSRIALVSDACELLGIAGKESAALDRRGKLRGGTTPLARCVANFAQFTGIGLARALQSATSVPAKILGLPDRGRIARGYRAEFVGLGPGGEVAVVVLGGVALEYVSGAILE